MKRNHLALLAGIVVMALLASSCDTLFTNQFKALGLGQVASNTLSNAVANHDSDTILVASGFYSGAISPSFINAVTTDPTTAANVLAQLQTTVTTSADPATVEAAEVLIVQIQLETSGAKTMIDNIVTAIGSVDFSTFNINSPSDLNSLLMALFPPRAGRLALPTGWTSANISTVIDTLVRLDGNIADLVRGFVNRAYRNSVVDAGWLAQVGIFITVLKSISFVSPYTTTGQAVAAMMDDFDPDNTTNFDPMHYVTIPSHLLDQIKADAQLNALFFAAGMNLTDLFAGFGL
ncbi:MAG: hypothetical protein NT061_02820 [Spirochaetes bacterium]|nr:hypothetical protein [Spirochaetota bacterium]